MDDSLNMIKESEAPGSAEERREPFHRVVSPGTVRLGPRSFARLFVEIHWDGKKLSLTGVEGPRANGNCLGSCGQCVDALDRINALAPGWFTRTVRQLREVWDRWHLNTMQAGTPAQMAFLREHKDDYPRYPTSHYDWARALLAEHGLNPDNGYRYGSAWLTVEVPTEVLDFLRDLPSSSHPYPWRLTS